MLQDYALLFNQFHMLPSRPACRNVTCVYACVCSFVLSQSWKDQSREDALRRRRERERERRARETAKQREARLYQRRLRDGERAYFHTLPSCHIDARSSQRKNSRLFAWIRCALERGCIYLFPIFVVLRFKF